METLCDSLGNFTIAKGLKKKFGSGETDLDKQCAIKSESN